MTQGLPLTAGGWDRGMKLEQTEKMNNHQPVQFIKESFWVQHPVDLGPSLVNTWEEEAYICAVQNKCVNNKTVFLQLLIKKCQYPWSTVSNTWDSEKPYETFTHFRTDTAFLQTWIRDFLNKYECALELELLCKAIGFQSTGHGDRTKRNNHCCIYTLDWESTRKSSERFQRGSSTFPELLHVKGSMMGLEKPLYVEWAILSVKLKK